MPNVALVALMLYGGVGGWFGIAMSVYLYRIREPPAHPALVLSVFSMGFVMVVGTILLHPTMSEGLTYELMFMAYTLLFVSQIMLVGMHTHPDARGQIRDWAFRSPKLSNSTNGDSEIPVGDESEGVGASGDGRSDDIPENSK